MYCLSLSGARLHADSRPLLIQQTLSSYWKEQSRRLADKQDETVRWSELYISRPNIWARAWFGNLSSSACKLICVSSACLQGELTTATLPIYDKVSYNGGWVFLGHGRHGHRRLRAERSCKE